MHNLHFYMNLMQRIREALEGGSFVSFRERFVGQYVRHTVVDQP